jgi:hypothetical protein
MVRGTWPICLRRAAAESCAPARNWRWMLASVFVGANFGLIGGLYRLGKEPARLTPDIVAGAARAAVIFFGVAWLVAVTIRFGRLLRTRRGQSQGIPS